MFSNPSQNIAQLGLREGMIVADFGAGTGAYSKAASYKVGNTGKVYAIEVQKNLVKKLESELNHWGISNVQCIWGDIENINGTKIADRSLDAVIIANVLFLTEDKLGIVDEAKRVLKKGGKILLVERNASNVLNKNEAIDFFLKRGLKVSENISTNASNYGIIFIYE